jgi:DNA-binding GntR family transcriptional regulator
LLETPGADIIAIVQRLSESHPSILPIGWTVASRRLSSVSEPPWSFRIARAAVVSISPQHSSLRCDHGQRRAVIVESLLKDVVHGRLRPGQHLVTQALAERFGVSHTPVREALIALAGIGIVDLVPNRGAVVRRVTARDIREVCQVRRALECEAVRSACGRIAPAELEAVRIELSRLTAVRPPLRPRFIEHARGLDSRLHDLITGHCGNAFLAHEISRLKILFRAFRDVAWELEEARNQHGRLAEEANEHLAIVDALLAGDRTLAARMMARHIKRGGRYWSQALPESAAPRSAAQES